jgi:putative colanic acid biosynthesis acetyltransferase WcaB
MRGYIFQDWEVNSQNVKARIIVVSFRLASLATHNKFLSVVLKPYIIAYRIFIEFILGTEINYKTKIGKNLRLFHAHALVINPDVVIGENCSIRHCTTIGNKQLKDGSFSKSPIIGNNVDIGSNVCIIGPITIGDNVKIGAGSVVVKDVPADCVVVGNPARIVIGK